jgi:hypothetical protein
MEGFRRFRARLRLQKAQPDRPVRALTEQQTAMTCLTARAIRRGTSCYNERRFSVSPV